MVQQGVLKGERFEAVCARPPLAGRRLIDQGSYSLLFEDEPGKSVYRLSSDNATHDFAAKATRRGLDGVVRLLADFGAVTRYGGSRDEPDYLWLAQLEYLERLDRHPEQHAAVRRLLVYLTDSEDGELLATGQDKEELMLKLDGAPTEPCTLKAVQAIQDLLPGYILQTPVDVDFSISNFMVRPATGDVVLSDPVNGLCNVPPERRVLLAAEGIVIERLDVTSA